MKTKFRTRQYARDLRSNLTDAETILWSKLRRKQLGGYRFHRQHPVGPFIADFACREAHLIVELDGATHSTQDERAADAQRTAYIEAQGWYVLRFWNAEVYDNLHGVLESILQRLPPPSR
jgi:very-short-patch-repair endonuclease